MPPERRKHPRYIPRKAAYVVAKPHFQRVGRIKEISMGSLSFEYLAQGGKAQAWDPVDIFLSEPFFYLPEIPCRVAYDIVVDEDMQLPHGFALRRCGVQFIDLTLEHQSKLAYFLKHFAILCEDGVSPLPIHEQVPMHQIACPAASGDSEPEAQDKQKEQRPKQSKNLIKP
jgi:hypothetical protein